MNFKYKEISEMLKLVNRYKYIICYTDGCSLRNPGMGGAGVAFFGQG